MATNKITMMLANSLHFNIQRRNDKCIMDVLTRELFSTKQLIHLNACRIYLNIIHLSDIVYPDDKSINHNFLIGIKSAYPSSNLEWPNQKYPSVKAWKLWNSIIKIVFNIQDNLTLGPFSRLGEWLTPASQRNMIHQWLYSPSRQEITTFEQGKITSHFIDTVDYESMQLNIDSKTELDDLYEDEITVLLRKNCFQPLNKFKTTACISSPPSTLIKHINTLTIWTRNLIQNHQHECLGPSLLEILQRKCDIIIANDGSKSESKLGGGWIIADSSGNIVTSGSNPDVGPITPMNSHRSEIYGVLSALLFLHEYFRFFMIPLSSHIKYFYDNFEVVNKMKKLIKDEQYYDEYIKTADHDAVRLLKHYIPRQFTINHVRNHKDKREKKSQLTTAERLNIAADELVGSTSSRPINSHINTPFALYLDGIYLSNHYRNKIRSSSGASKAREFLK